MIKLVECLRRLPNLSRREFLDYWHDHHGPLALSLQKALGYRKYIQFHTISTPLDDVLYDNPGVPEPFDGIAEVWWESLEAVQRSLVDPAAQAAWTALKEDEKNFIDLEHTIKWFGKDQLMFSDKNE